MSLATEFRPTTLAEVLGNEGVKASLQAILSRSDLQPTPKAYLFAGPSGCGKTTLARIMASALGVASDGIFEINVGNCRGIDTIRESVLPFTDGGQRPISGLIAFILDESHAYTADAQKSLLKAVEDCPDHAFFFFCTTEPERLIAPLRNRCSIFQVSPLNEDETLTLLLNAVDKYHFSVPDEILAKIATASEGVPREALKLLEQVQGISDPKAIDSFLCSAGKNAETIEICRQLVSRGQTQANKWNTIRSLYSNLSADPESVRRSILGYMKACLLKSGNIVEADRFNKLMELFLAADVWKSGEPALVWALYVACGA